ncbi:hypothetical protein BV898_09777 [Hypsibius exemplaris]|uniref:Uncharacterized protein n=1 Tax=Hypsibius exemplaris TaxID=2072580 RepID=A0A1W0WLU0_HYPEX|nr:hypothetical protein BV898_09777 [Hypsibius exemplaris]
MRPRRGRAVSEATVPDPVDGRYAIPISRPVAVRKTFSIVWSTVVASMAIVVITFIINGPAIILALLELSPALPVVRFLMYLAMVKHVYSPLIYCLFFPDYRVVLARFLQNIRSGRARGKLRQNPRIHKPQSQLAPPSHSERL